MEEKILGKLGKAYQYVLGILAVKCAAIAKHYGKNLNLNLCKGDLAMIEEKKLTDDTEIDVGMIEKTLGIDDTIYVWLLKGSIWKTYNLQKSLT